MGRVARCQPGLKAARMGAHVVLAIARDIQRVDPASRMRVEHRAADAHRDRARVDVGVGGHVNPPDQADVDFSQDDLLSARDRLGIDPDRDYPLGA